MWRGESFDADTMRRARWVRALFACFGEKVSHMIRMHLLAVLGLVACGGLAVSHAAGQEPKKQTKPAEASNPVVQGGTGKVARTPLDLTVQEYVIAKKPSELFDDKEGMKKLIEQVKADSQRDLRELNFGDPRLARMLHGVLASIALIEADLDTAQGHYDKMRELDQIASSKPLNGVVMMAAARAMKGAGMDAAKAEPAFEADFRTKMNAMDWSVVGPQVMADRRSAELLTESFLRERLPSAYDPGWDSKTGKLDIKFVHGLIGMRASLELMVPMTPAAIRVYNELTNRNEGPLPDIWDERQISLTGQEGGSPVVVATWGFGVDASALGAGAWTNPGEQANGIDDDGDGFVDNIHGLAWDQMWNVSPDLLMSLIDVRCEPQLVHQMAGGNFDEFADLHTTPRRIVMQRYMQRLQIPQRQTLQRDMNIMMLRAQGTHAASVILAGNPYAKVQSVRLGYEDFRRPGSVPSIEASERGAQAIRAAAAAARKAGVRVVHIGWQLSLNDIVAMLEQHGVGDDERDRLRIGSPIFRPIRLAMEEVIRNYPEILFVGGVDSTRQYESNVNDAVPTQFLLPNFVVINNVNGNGLPNKFTSKVPLFTLFAKGRDVQGVVPSTTPGGEPSVMSGPNVASAQGANLAAKILALHPSLRPDQVVDLMKRGGHQLPRNKEGMLMVDPRRTLELAKQGQ
jgi:hypothetical protein